MKILYINAMGPYEAWPQAGVFVSERVAALRKNGVDVTACSYYQINSPAVQRVVTRNGGPDLGTPIAQQAGVTYGIRRIPNGFFSAAMQRFRPNFWEKRIARQVRRDREESKADLIHLHWIWPMGLGVMRYCRETGVPYVLTCHGGDIYSDMKDMRKRPYILKMLEGAAAVEFVSKALLESAKELGYSGKNAAVVYNGIRTSVFYPARQEHPGKTVVGFAGVMILRKGIDYLPEIFRRIQELIPGEIHFYMIGSGVLREEIEKKMAGLPVDFLGTIPSEKLAERFNEMDILLLPSRQEGYGCVIKEAQACGAVPIGRDVDGIREAVDGFGSLIAYTGDDDAFISAFAEETAAYVSGEKPIDRAAMEAQAARCSWEERQKDSIAIYQRILGKAD